MKHGKLFFFNMGNITTGARIAILPLIYLTFFQVRPLGIAFFTGLVLLVLSIGIAMIPAPSDRAAKRTIEEFHHAHKEEMMTRCGFSNDRSLMTLYGYAEDGSMWMKRRLGRDMIYPTPAALGFASHLGHGKLLIGTKSLLEPTPEEYCFLQDGELSEAVLTVTPDPENEAVAILKVVHPSQPHDMTFYVKNDFHIRDFMDAVRPHISK